MKPVFKILCILLLVGGLQNNVKAQQVLDPGKLNYFINPKTNTLLYEDTLYRGAREFKALFYRMGDPLLIHLYQKHQSNKIFGNILGVLGAGMMGAGVGLASNNHQSTGWILIGAGFTSTIVGGYLIASGQKNLLMAVQFFNEKQHQKLPKIQASIGFSANKIGLAINF